MPSDRVTWAPEVVDNALLASEDEHGKWFLLGTGNVEDGWEVCRQERSDKDVQGDGATTVDADQSRDAAEKSLNYHREIACMRAALDASPLGDAVKLIERLTADLAAMCARAKQQEHWDIQPDGHAQDLAAGEASARDAAAFVARVREGK